MTEDPRICLAGADHIAALPDVELRAAARFRGLPVPDRVFTDPIGLNVLERLQAQGHLWVALRDSDDPIGFIGVEPHDDSVHIRELDVLPECSGRGVGSSLLAAVEQWASEQGYLEVTLTTFTNVSWNAPFYAKRGYRALGSDELNVYLEDRLRLEAEAGFEHRVAMSKRLVAIY